MSPEEKTVVTKDGIYQYKFIKIELRPGFNTSHPKEDYHKIIEAEAKQGWRLVQVFAPPTESFGSSAYFEIIMERMTFN